MENENETSNISDFPYMDIEIVTLSKVSSITTCVCYLSLQPEVQIAMSFVQFD